MAFLQKGPGPTGGKIYNVEQAVGKTGVNAQGDVKLVQYMLKHIYGAQAAGLAVDGWIGPTTNSWIDRFQKDCKAQGHNVLVDGRIDRALAQVSTVSKTTYAVIIMNTKLRQVNPSAYSSLPNSVPLSAKPKANPYNPDIKKIIKATTVPSGKIKLITYFFEDGTQQKALVGGDGKLQFEPAPPGPSIWQQIFNPQPIQPYVIDIRYSYKLNMTVYHYQDGTISVHKGPPGGVIEDYGD